MLTVLEKIIILQEVELFKLLSTEDLAHIAAIAEEVDYSAGSEIYHENGIPDSMYLVLDGQVRLHQGDNEVMTAEVNDAFGTWALLDDEPRVVTATAEEDSRLIRIDKDDFIDLLADNVSVTQGVMKMLVKRVRRLMALSHR